ncbi:MAG: recombination protein RecA [Parcubacteria group bacterium Licking1014_17]|nr:MAG: recombination protein RecA [Parcubacteria group bacterium Licking1014_17]
MPKEKTKKEEVKAKSETVINKGAAGTEHSRSTASTERSRSIDLAVREIQEKYGEGSIMKLGDAKKVDVDVIPTGSISLDLALGVGGVPRGRVIEIYGPESSGKTTLALHLVAEAQKQGGVAAYVDAEHALDPEYAKKIGVKIGDLLISQPDTGEQGLEIVETLVRSGGVSLVVIDSVAALTPRAEIEGEMDQQHMGLQARLMSHALRKLTAIIAKTNTTVVFINQIRLKIGIMFGNPETTTGGLALKFYSSVRIEIRRSAQIQSKEKIIGNRVKVKVVKNKVAAPFRTAEFDILYNEGISKQADVVNTGVAFNVVEKSGSWFIYNKEKLGQGIDGARQFLKDNPKVEKDIIVGIKKAVAETEKTEEK